ncbi:hypothetical protein Tco_1509833 [Tanacetum coccineum]
MTHMCRSLYRPPSPDYIPGLEEPQSPPLPDFVPEPVYLEFMPPEDKILPAKEQPLPAADSPTVNSPGYILESNPKEDPADYPADGGDDGDDEDEPSDDDEDEEVDIKADDEEEEEHPAPADSTVVALPAIDQAPSAEETEPFETDESVATPPPHPAYRVTARISILAPVPTPVWSDAEVARLLAIPTPPPSPLSPWSSPLPQIPFPPLPPIPSPSLPLSPPLPVSAPLPASPIPPTSLLPLLLPSTNRREDRPEVTLPPRKKLGIALGPRYEIRRDLERDVGYGITDYWDEIVEVMQGTPVVTDMVEFNQRMTEFETRVRQDTNKIYTRLDDEQSERQLMVGRLNMLYRDRRTHARIARLMETEARIDYRATGSRPQEVGGDYKDVGGRSQEAEAVHRGTEAAEEASDLDDRKMAPKRRTTRLNLETTSATTAATTTTVTNAQLQAMIDQGVTAILAARNANTNGVDSHNSKQTTLAIFYNLICCWKEDKGLRVWINQLGGQAK